MFITGKRCWCVTCLFLQKLFDIFFNGLWLNQGWVALNDITFFINQEFLCNNVNLSDLFHSSDILYILPQNSTWFLSGYRHGISFLFMQPPPFQLAPSLTQKYQAWSSLKSGREVLRWDHLHPYTCIILWIRNPPLYSCLHFLVTLCWEEENWHRKWACKSFRFLQIQWLVNDACKMWFISYTFRITRLYTLTSW